MRKHSLLNVACYGLAIALSCLPGAWSAPYNTTRDGFEKSPRSSVMKRAITVDPNTCVGTWRTSVDSAVREALDMVNYAIPRFQTLLNNLNSNPVPSIIGMNNEQRTVFQTYEAFFGQTYFGTDTQANRDKNAAAIVRLNKLISTAQRIQAALQNPGSVNLEIYCGDSFLWDTDPTGTISGFGVMEFDSRRWNSHQIGEWVALQTCTKNPGMSAYAYHPLSPPFFEESVIVLCLDYMVGWAARYSAGNTVAAYHDALPLVTNTYQMDYLWGYLPATLLHELTHARTVMKSDAEILGDQCLRNNAPAYQWQCIRQLAQENADFAAANADTFSLFVTGK
ncbi:hypothetical protein C8A01DRAFT_36376 [Parachaetomium inaequale]|uniref:Lysine-specific metallo-endopeptidase domain-containing protein n=1 Tax=Parachaetomium inaequale TaxID=2588326 RepID=A0AAN6PFF7_9PEZI|nr:hypothetical protein C8A01DRAFT_36376 [Parachaetomium inaequale]